MFCFLEQLETVPILISRPCAINDTIDYPYYFKGKYSNGRFEGPGKLEMKFKGSKKYTKGELAKMNKTCIVNNGYLNKKVIEVVGNFKNGLIHGPAKVKLQYDFVVISNFENGTMVGLQRHYKNKTKMNNYYFAVKGSKKSWGWQEWHGYLVYHDFSFIKENETSELSLLIPMDTSEDILVGSINTLHGQTNNLKR